MAEPFSKGGSKPSILAGRPAASRAVGEPSPPGGDASTDVNRLTRATGGTPATGALSAPTRILVVDDEPLVRMATVRILRMAGYEVVEAANGEEGLRLTRQMRPDLVLLDLMLPDLNGLEVCRRIKSEAFAATSLVVFLTSSSPTSEEQADGLATGADGYVLRPVSKRELLERINALLRLRRAEQALRESEERFRALFESIPHIVWTANAEGALTFCNRRALEFSGSSVEELSAQGWQNYIHPDDLDLVLPVWQRAVATGEDYRAECRYRRAADGEYRWHSNHAVAVRDPEGRVQHWYGTSTEIHERRLAQAALQQANEQLERQVQQRTEDLLLLTRTLQTINACQQAILHSSNEQDLLQTVCRLILEVGGFHMAWVGWAEHDPAKRVRPVASAGVELHYLDEIRVTWGPNRLGRGPTGTAIRTAQVCRCDDFASDPRLKPWREQALRRGYRSSIALPLLFEGQMLGALTIYAVRPAAFNDRQTAVLKQLADNLAFGICSLRAQADRNLARQELEHKAQQLRVLAAELTRAEQRERRRLAQHLHDDLQQLLMAARYGMDSLKATTPAPTARAEMQAVTRLLDEAIAAARSLVFDLVPPILFDLGLAPALEWLARRMAERHGLKVRLRVDPTCAVEGEMVRVLLFQSVRELLLNVVKHAQVKTAFLSLRQTPAKEVILVVRDRGVGFYAAKLGRDKRQEGGFGLFSIRERLEVLGAHLLIESQPGQGCRCTLRAPPTAGAPRAAALPPVPPNR